MTACSNCQGQGFWQDHNGLRPCSWCNCTGHVLTDRCPAGGDHTWVELTAWEAGPGGDRGGWRCDECGATP